MWNGHLAVLVTTLLGIRNLVLDLNRAGTCLDHFLGQQVGCFLVTEAGIDVCNNGHYMCFVVLDRLQRSLFLNLVACFTGVVQILEQVAHLTGICLAQECVQLFDKCRYRSLLVHGLVGQGTELAAQCRDHPT